MNLQAGRVRVDVNPPAGSKAALSVSSPSATASVRGTSFTFDTRNVRVREGTVAFKGKVGYTVRVGAGSSSGIAAYSMASASQKEAPVPPTPVGYDPSTSASTGGTGVAGAPDEPAPPKPPTTPPGGGSSGGGGGGNSGGNSGGNNTGGGSTGGVGIDVGYPN